MVNSILLFFCLLISTEFIIYHVSSILFRFLNQNLEYNNELIIP